MQSKGEVTLYLSPVGANLSFTSDSKIQTEKVSIREIIIPNTFYNVVAPQNTFVTGAGTATIPPGNYSTATLITSLQTLLQAIDATFTVTQNANTNFITVARSTNFTVTANQLSTRLGFSANLSGASTYTAALVPYLAIPAILVANNVLYERKNYTTNSNFNPPNLFLTVPNNGNSGAVVFYTPPYPLIYDVNPQRNLLNSTFTFYDYYGNLLNLNNPDANIIITFNFY
jgi:hypothetical protein